MGIYSEKKRFLRRNEALFRTLTYKNPKVPIKPIVPFVLKELKFLPITLEIINIHLELH